MFTQPVGINGNIHTFNATINDLRIPEDLVLRHTRQRILGKKIFKNTVEVEKSIIINGTTNGRDLSEFSKQVVTLSTNQVINGNKTFINGFSVAKNLDVSGLVDGVNLTEIDLDAARIDQPEVIRGLCFHSFHQKGFLLEHFTTSFTNMTISHCYVKLFNFHFL